MAGVQLMDNLGEYNGIKNVTRYIPDAPDYDNNFLYFRSEDGQDFYESLSKFTKNISCALILKI